MTRDDQTEFREILESSLEKYAGRDPETHNRHHDFIESEIERRLIQRNRCEWLTRQALGWGLIATITGLAYAVGDFIKNHLVNGNGPHP